LGLRRREARNDLLAAHERHVSTRAGLAAGAGLLDDADALLEAAETAYTEGEIGLVELLDAARAFRDAGTTAVALQADAWIAYYDMLRAMGRASEEIR
jgi:outer membrane protein TolC